MMTERPATSDAPDGEVWLGAASAKAPPPPPPGGPLPPAGPRVRMVGLMVVLTVGVTTGRKFCLIPPGPKVGESVGLIVGETVGARWRSRREGGFDRRRNVGVGATVGAKVGVRVGLIVGERSAQGSATQSAPKSA